MSQQLRDEAQQLAVQLDDSRTRLKNAQAHIKSILPDVLEVEKVAKRRKEQMDKRYRLQRKIVAIAMRYPDLLESPTTRIISNNISIMKRQLDLTRARQETAERAFSETDRHRAELEQKLAIVAGEKRRQEEMVMRRDREKTELVRALGRELDSAKMMYQGEFRSTERALAAMKQNASEMHAEIVNARQEYQRGCEESLRKGETAASRALAEKRRELVNAVDAFLEFWAQRRIAKYWSNREEVLARALSVTTDRRAASYESIRATLEANGVATAELGRVRNLKEQIEGDLRDVEKKQKAVRQQVEKLMEEKAKPNYTREEEEKIKALREEVDELEKEAKMTELEVRTYEGVYNGPTRGEMRYMKERLRYRKELRIMGDLMLQIENAKEKKAGKGTGRELANVGEPRLMLVEDGESTLVQAAPLDVLVSMLFHPGNTDTDYPQALLVLVHSESAIDIDEFVRQIMKCYEETDYWDTRKEKLSSFMNTWMEWFPNDFQGSSKKANILPLFNLIGSSGVFGLQPSMEENVIWDPSVPFNEKEQVLVFCATPLVLAEHFAYLELQIVRDIPPCEFIGTGWSAIDKWEKAPHICKMMDHFNTVSTWIVKSIVKEPRLKNRCLLLRAWIKVMEAAREIRNYQLVFEIFGALCSPAIFQLKKTWAKLDPEITKTYAALKDLTSPTGQFAQYRRVLGETAKQITVPYIGHMLTSLVYVNDGSPSKKSVPDSSEVYWNISKFRSYSQIIAEINSDWGSEIKFILNPELFRRITGITPVEDTEAELFQMAQELRETQQ